MKELKLSALAFATLLFTACSGNSQDQMTSDHQMKEGNIKQKKGMMLSQVEGKLIEELEKIKESHDKMRVLTGIWESEAITG